MTDPLDTNALRIVAQVTDQERSTRWASAALRDAADEVDRLRANLGTQERVNADLVVAWDAMREDRNRLRKLIEEAPHDPFGCGLVRSQQRTGYCNCWKADTLG